MSSKESELDSMLNELDYISTSKPNTTDNGNKVKEPNEIFKKAIENSQFEIFESIGDLGYFRWTPTGAYKEISDIKNIDELLDFIDISKKPDYLVDINLLEKNEIPMNFASIPPQKHLNKYPYSNPNLAPIYVATKHRGLDNLDEVDFILRGSVLDFLATGNNKSSETEYLATVVAGTKKTIMVVKHHEYEQDYSAPGFQFEQFVTGKSIRDEHDVHFNVHMHLMNIGKYKVLLLGQTDAIDEDGPVEIAASNPYWWGTNKMFQMISNGSTKLCHGKKYRGTVSGIDLISISSMIDSALASPAVDVSTLEKNIIANLDALQKSSDSLKTKSSRSWKIFFSPNNKLLQLDPYSRDVLFPSDDIVEELLFE